MTRITKALATPALALTLALAATTITMAFTTATATAAAPTTKELAGTWNGEITAQGRPVPVPFKLTVQDKGRGETAAEIAWGAPYVCKSTLQFASMRDKTFLLTVTAGNGPFCDSLVNGHLDLTPGDADHAAAVLTNGKNVKVSTTSVERAAR